MKTVRKTTEIIEHGAELVLRDVVVQNKTYELRVGNRSGRLSLDFYSKEQPLAGARNNPDFAIAILDGGLVFERHCHRPEHDHDDTQMLYRVKEGAFMRTPGDLVWWDDMNDHDLQLFSVPFGATTERY